VETKDPSSAKQAVDQGFTALRLDANAAAVRYTLAVTLAGTGKRDEAIAELRHALALQPNFDDARRELGNALAAQGRIDEALVEFDRAIAARPQFWGHYSAKGRSLYTAARYEEAAAAFRRASEVQPDNSTTFQLLGTVHQQLGQKEEALRNYEKAIAIRPTPETYSNIGTLHYQQREFDKAAAAYRQAIAIRPNSAATHRNLGDALRRLGDTEAARESYRRAVTLIEADLKINPFDPLTIAASAVYLEKAGRDAEARARIGQALAAAPRQNQVLHRAAMVHALAGRTAEALSALEQAIANGYSRAAAAQDDEFESIRHTTGFTNLVAPPGAGEKKR
jgi:tetratricopeptide (TPR) repeat protein